MNSIFEFKKKLLDYSANKIDESDIDWIICKSFGVSRAEIVSSKAIPTKQAEKRAFKLLKKRLKGVPLSHLFKSVNFYGYDFYVNKNVLSPRFETEELVDLIIKKIDSGCGLDIGVGSGAISITINKLNNKIKMLGVDISKKALAVANKNRKLLKVEGVQFKQSNLFSRVEGVFDFIVSNPPYIKTSEIAGLDNEVKDYDPLIALDGGEDGLDFYRRIIEKAPKFLKDSGYIFFEVGKCQAEDVKNMLEKEFKDVTIIKDLQKIERIVYAKKR